MGLPVKVIGFCALILQMVPDTLHRIYYEDSRAMGHLAENSVDLVVTSPPYPMVSMWDSTFFGLNPLIGEKLSAGDGWGAYSLMHQELDRTWKRVDDSLKEGGFVCINIGDAIRTLGGRFCLYPSHSRITDAMIRLGYTPLPGIIWSKPSNSPNKFLGSGMLPAGAYVTLEHEHILIFRKGERREFTVEEKELRRKSSYFWEERNKWFTDIWSGVRGARQNIKSPGSRERSGAFPIELPLRLISMFSIKGDTVLDPFLGTGTTTVSSILTGRNSIGFEVDSSLGPQIGEKVKASGELSARYTEERIGAHSQFVKGQQASGREMRYLNSSFGIPVKERSEQFMELEKVELIRMNSDGAYSVSYSAVQPLQEKQADYGQWQS